MTLKASGSIAEITVLTFEIVEQCALKVSFTGKRRRQYNNKPPASISIAGTCNLASEFHPCPAPGGAMKPLKRVDLRGNGALQNYLHAN